MTTDNTKNQATESSENTEVINSITVAKLGKFAMPSKRRSMRPSKSILKVRSVKPHLFGKALKKED